MARIACHTPPLCVYDTGMTQTSTPAAAKTAARQTIKAAGLKIGSIGADARTTFVKVRMDTVEDAAAAAALFTGATISALDARFFTIPR